MVAHGCRRTVLSLTTRFCLPHEGMTKLEYLSRGSAFLLDPTRTLTANKNSNLSDIKVLTCQHVTCPWLYPKYFEDKWEWLQYVSEEFVHHSLELIDIPISNGTPPKILATIPLQSQLWLHPDRDVAMLAIDQEQVQWEELCTDLNLTSLVLDTKRCEPGNELIYYGHRQEQSLDDQHSTAQYPKQVTGHFVGQTSQDQAFGWSREVLEEGMCGGAVINASSGECVGVIEGIVPAVDTATAPIERSLFDSEEAYQAAIATARMQQKLANHVAFVPTTTLVDFVRGDQAQWVLTGLGIDV